MRVDVLAGEPHFVDHLAPVWLALPERLRGDFVVRRSRYTHFDLPRLVARAKARGVDAVTEGDPGRAVLVASVSDCNAARKLGYRVLARMEHGIGQSFAGSQHDSYAGGAGAGDVGLFLVPNGHSRDRWREAYPAARVEVVGCPKLDSLPARGPGPKPVVALSFHWGIGQPSSADIPETQGSFSHYEAIVPHLRNRFRLVGTGHPRVMSVLAPRYRKLGIRVVEDFHDVCREADVLACDTNSALFEFASTGRPVLVMDAPWYRYDAGHGLRFGEASGIGPHCTGPLDILPALELAIEDPPGVREAREAALDVVYANRTGAAQRAARAIGSWLRSLPARAEAA